METSTIQSINIELESIVFSPFNYRYGGAEPKKADLKELAESIKIHDVIQRITVRLVTGGKYELVAGERRVRAARLAGKITIPADVKVLSDEEVKEIQLTENLQRENPHPMAEALGIYQLLHLTGKKNSVKEIARRIAKSEAYVYQRLKLVDLTESFREMFLGDAITFTQAVMLARLEPDAQADFFEQYCIDWKDEDWDLHQFNNRINNYQLDLTKAPFDIKDPKLDKAAGACTKCPFNTAFNNSLFPEESKDARCTKRACFNNKSKLSIFLNLTVVMNENPELPIAVVDDTVLTGLFEDNYLPIMGRVILIEDVDFQRRLDLEDKPVREDFSHYDDEDENEGDYNDAMDYYNNQIKRMEEGVIAGRFCKAIWIEESEPAKIAYLSLKSADGSGVAEISTNGKLSAKVYQEAVKTKSLSKEIIVGERERLEQKEIRSKEIDEDKLQESFYTALKESETAKDPNTPGGANDRAVGIFLIYSALGYSERRFAENTLFPEPKGKKKKLSFGPSNEDWIQFFFNATEPQVSFITRLAMLSQSDAKLPRNLCGQIFRLMMEATPGIDANELKNIQNTVAYDRQNKLNQKLMILDIQEKKLE